MKVCIGKPPTNEEMDHTWTLVISGTCIQAEIFSQFLKFFPYFISY